VAAPPVAAPPVATPPVAAPPVVFNIPPVVPLGRVEAFPPVAFPPAEVVFEPVPPMVPPPPPWATVPPLVGAPPAWLCPPSAPPEKSSKLPTFAQPRANRIGANVASIDTGRRAEVSIRSDGLITVCAFRLSPVSSDGKYGTNSGHSIGRFVPSVGTPQPLATCRHAPKAYHTVEFTVLARG
jgi:hypothetical protein